MTPTCSLERVIRELVSTKDYQRVHDILEQLCNEYAYAVHQPHARNGGLIGLAAAAIALGSVCSVPGLPSFLCIVRSAVALRCPMHYTLIATTTTDAICKL